MLFWVLIFSVPLGGFFVAGLAVYLRYRQHRAMLDVVKVYAERGEAPPSEVLAALTKTCSMSGVMQPASSDLSYGSNKGQGPLHYWSLVGLFSAMSGGFAYAAWASGPAGYPFVIVAFTMGAVGVWALVMAIGLTLRK